MPDTFVASANIAPSVFVMLDPSNSFQVLQASATTNTQLIGISQEGSQQAPGVTGSSAAAALTNNLLLVYVMNDVCLLQINSNVTTGDELTPDANGYGVTITESANTAEVTVGAKAEQSGIAGDFIRVKVLSPYAAVHHL